MKREVMTDCRLLQTVSVKPVQKFADPYVVATSPRPTRRVTSRYMKRAFPSVPALDVDAS